MSWDLALGTVALAAGLFTLGLSLGYLCAVGLGHHRTLL